MNLKVGGDDGSIPLLDECFYKSISTMFSQILHDILSQQSGRFCVFLTLASRD